MNYIQLRHQRLERIAKKLGVEKEPVSLEAWMQNALDDMEITGWEIDRLNEETWNLQNQTKNG